MMKSTMMLLLLIIMTLSSSWWAGYVQNKTFFMKKHLRWGRSLHSWSCMLLHGCKTSEQKDAAAVLQWSWKQTLKTNISSRVITALARMDLHQHATTYNLLSRSWLMVKATWSCCCWWHPHRVQWVQCCKSVQQCSWHAYRWLLQ